MITFRRVDCRERKLRGSIESRRITSIAKVESLRVRPDERFQLFRTPPGRREGYPNRRRSRTATAEVEYEPSGWW
jgi:hypothetical protein